VKLVHLVGFITKKNQILYFLKIIPAEVATIYADGQTEMSKFS